MSNAPWLWPGSLITRVVDGDSLTARLTRDLGFHGTATFEVKLRLNRINAPAVNTDTGKIAGGALVALFPADVHVNIETTKAYKYGDEWMAEITLADGTNVSDWMVTGGYAVYWNGQGPRPGG